MAGGWMAGGWMAGGWMAGGWMAGNWMAGGWMAGCRQSFHGRSLSFPDPFPRFPLYCFLLPRPSNPRPSNLQHINSNQNCDYHKGQQIKKYAKKNIPDDSSKQGYLLTFWPYTGWVGIGWLEVGWPGVGWPGGGWPGVGWPGVGWPEIGWLGVGWPGAANHSMAVPFHFRIRFPVFRFTVFYSPVCFYLT